MELEDVGCEDDDWIQTDLNRVKRQTSVDTVIKLPVPLKAGIL